MSPWDAGSGNGEGGEKCREGNVDRGDGAATSMKRVVSTFAMKRTLDTKLQGYKRKL